MHFLFYTHLISRQMLLKQGMHMHAHIMLCHNAISSAVSCQCVCSDSKSLHLFSEQQHAVLQPQRVLPGPGRKKPKSVKNGRQREGQWLGQLANRFLDKSNFCSMLRNSHNPVSGTWICCLLTELEKALPLSSDWSMLQICQNMLFNCSPKQIEGLKESGYVD